MAEQVTLADVDWGDVVAETDGVLLVEGSIETPDGSHSVLVKRYADGEDVADAANHLLLAQLGLDVLPVLGHGPGWLVLEHPGEQWGWRLAEAEDAIDDRFAVAVDRWCARLESVFVPELAEGSHLTLAAPRWPLWAVTEDLAQALPVDLRAVGVSSRRDG